MSSGQGTWSETNLENKYAIAIHNFHLSKTEYLTFDVGDSLLLIYETKGWYYGTCLRDGTKKGIIPKTFIKVKEVVDVQGCFYPKESPLVREITSVLKEWGTLWKDLYLKSIGTENKSDAEKLSKTMLELMDFRRLILSSKLTVDEMKELQQKVTQKIDIGNARLKLDLVVRDDHGNVIDPLHTSTINLFKLHQQATKLINEEKDTASDKQALKKAYSFNLYVNVKNFVCRIGENAHILLTLYDAKEGTFISEHYIMKWGDQGMLKDLDSFSNMRVIYTDLNEKDILGEKIFLVCQIIRIGRMDLKEPDSKKLTHGMKRPFGVASIEVSDILKGKMDSDDEKQYFIPFLQCGEHDFMEVVIKKSISAKDINHKGQGLWVTMRNLVGDLTQLQKEYPHLVTSTTTIARKMGFPDVIMPGDVRNDLYVTIKQGEFKKGGNKMADKNIQITLSICNENGEVINGMISEGSSGSMVNQYETIIYYHEDRPKWCETVKVSIPINDSTGVHLKFTMKHRSTTDAKDKAEKPFAMSYIQLMNDDGTILNNTDHDLLVYKLDSKKAEEQSNVYFKLPSTQKELQKLINSSGSSLKSNNLCAGSLILSANDVFQISTLICSTKLTHNVELMGLLKWRDNPQDLEVLLNYFMSVDGGEVVKFLQDSLDALFNILIENSDSDLYDKLVFDALVFLLSIVSDHKYNQFKPVLDVYIKDSFSATLAYTKLMLVLKSYIEDVSSLPKTTSVMKAFKSLDYIFKFIVHSRLLFAALHENKGKQQFELLLGQLFGSINKMIREGREITNGVCAMFLDILPSIIPHLLLVYNPIELSEVLIECINSVPLLKLVLRKMHCIDSLVHSQLFKLPDCRRLLLPVFLDHVHQLLTMHVDTMPNRHYFDPDMSDYNELDICLKVLSDILDYLFTCDGTMVYDEMKVISIKMLRLVTKTVIFMDKESPLTGTCVAVMTSILRQMSEQHYNNYIGNFETPFDLMDFLMEILMIIEELVRRNVYPFDWSEMIGLQNWVFMNALRYFSNTIRNQFTTPFYFELWKRFFLSSIEFINQGPLQLEEFSSSKRNKIISQYKDMRREAGLEVRSMWHSLGQHKIDFIPEIVGPFLHMTMTCDRELRKWTIPIFFDMMKVELSHNIANGYKRNFLKFEQELVVQLDELITSNHGDESYQEMFYEIIKDHCENNKIMRDQGLAFNDTIKQLFQLLLQYRTVLKEDNYDNKMICTVSLLNFYNESNRNELYIRYLNKLCALHLECNNRTEAGYTLLLYAKLLKWSDEPLPPVLMSPHFPDLKTHRKLKERLYFQITTYFDEGKMWEKAIELCKELASQCEIETFDYTQLANMLRKQALLYDSIMKTIRPEPEYFRVAYYGMGFHPFLQNRTFIYRGKDYERLSDFISRLLNQFPNAQLMKTLNAPNESIKQQQNKFIQVNKVTPIMELNNNLASKRLSDQILRYFKVNEVQKFTYSRKKDESISEMSLMWLERTVLVTSHPFPGILHWFPVTSTQTFDVSPLELAIETLEETNQKLKSLVEQQLTDPTSKVDQLGMVLHGVVDAAVNGGIANYKVFYTEDYLKERTLEEHKMVECLKRCTTMQVVILREALNLHCERAPENLKPFHSHLEQRYNEMRKTLEKEYGIKLNEDDYVKNNVKQSMSVVAHSSASQVGSVKRAQSMTPSKLKEVEKQSAAVPIRTTTSGPTIRTQIPFNNLLRSKADSGFSSYISSSSEVSSPTKSTASTTLNKQSFLRTSFNTIATNDNNVKSTTTSCRVSVTSTGSNNKCNNSNSSCSTPSLNELTSLMRPNDFNKTRPPSNVSLNLKPAMNPLTTVVRMLTNNTSSSTLDCEEPPPLPDKSSHSDYANVDFFQTTRSQTPMADTPLVYKASFKDRPPLPVPTTPNKINFHSKKQQKEFTFGDNDDNKEEAIEKEDKEVSNK